MVVSGIICNECNHFIFSRAQHDFHWCKCGSCAIDGGRAYLKVVGPSEKITSGIKITVDCTERELYCDWAFGHDQYGTHLVDDVTIIVNKSEENNDGDDLTSDND